MTRPLPLAREALLSAVAAGTLAACLAWLGPPGSDLAAHVYQRTFFLHHGLSLWNNFWYAGRYSFVTYSVAYYPLAALLGIKLLAVATISTAALAFAVVVDREWGPAARWSSRTFAVVWAGIVLSAAFPFALGFALGLLSLWSLQERRPWRFAVLAVLTLAASPLAFLLLVVVLAGLAFARRPGRKSVLVPTAAVAVACLGELVLWRLFPGAGRYPFSWAELAAACVFCLLGIALTWRVARARLLRSIFAIYLAACLAAFAVPSSLGENIARLRYVAIPLAVLTLSLRRWRPLPVALAALALAAAWNLSPLAGSFVKGIRDPSADAAYWQPAIRFFHERLTPSFRVEAVDTVGHWDAVYLARAGIPIARGWFRQDDFPQNAVLYAPFGSRAYIAWLRELGVRYVVLTGAPPDYSARAEAALLRSGRSGLVPAFRTPDLTIYAVPSPRPLLTGPGQPRLISFAPDRIRIRIPGPGRYRLAVRYSPYWEGFTGCTYPGADGMVRLFAARGGLIDLRFGVTPERALATLRGGPSRHCETRNIAAKR